jgi:16S rRNA (cytidine1402-2'-O)-methyltransferase
VPVTVLPGPSAVETALVASGLVWERYQFVGYLPRTESARAALWSELSGWPDALVAFESPRRLPASLRSLAEALPDRPVAVCRELTKRFEEVIRGSADELARRFSEPPRGEITVVVGPAEVERGAESDALAAVSELVEAGVGRRTAANLVARLTGHSRNRLYRSSL